MAVDRIVQYRQKDGKDTLKVFFRPSKHFPKGSYFYCDAEDGDLVYKCGWGLFGKNKAVYVYGNKDYNNINFHQEVALKHLGSYCECIDHYNHCGFDNCDVNLFNVTTQENSYNRQDLGYHNWNKKYWVVTFIAPDRTSFSRSVLNEYEACKLRREIEKQNLTHNYNFLEDRSNAIDILDMERTGQISHEEAIYRHVKRYSQNAWYYYRYDLDNYFSEYHIPVPEYDLDEQGFMIDIYSRRKLCPAWKELRALNMGIDIMGDFMQMSGQSVYSFDFVKLGIKPRENLLIDDNYIESLLSDSNNIKQLLGIN